MELLTVGLACANAMRISSTIPGEFYHIFKDVVMRLSPSAWAASSTSWASASMQCTGPPSH
ncbi:hypothetical protein BC938DRAFT_480626 [Jimgerdemannia flammicorona]|uniref:Uncharacterized protein n=1 Tax=Jimgerdemannia flammicorona TaxID=994334 RepID=A0A433QI47_9FUNG|nr:hypothetical protein BC938DRAFT_480626 [Jimgerdemannia flammicorona]